MSLLELFVSQLGKPSPSGRACCIRRFTQWKTAASSKPAGERCPGVHVCTTELRPVEIDGLVN